MKLKYVFVNWLNVESIEQAERKKALLENSGYRLKTVISGPFTADLVYEKPTDKK